MALSIVGVPTVAGAHDGDDEFGIEHVIDDAVVTDPDAPRAIFSDKLRRRVRARVVRQALDSGQEPGPHRWGQFADLLVAAVVNATE